MNALDLMARLGGEILAHKIRARIDGNIVILAKLEGQDWVLTDKGQELANAHSNMVVSEATKAASTFGLKARKKAVAAVESVQLALDTEPEQDDTQK